MFPFNIINCLKYSSTERRFRAELRNRGIRFNETEDFKRLSVSHRISLNALRKVLKEELELENLFLTDNLREMIPDFPAEEILTDALDKIDHACETPCCEEWDGTLCGLVAILGRIIGREKGAGPLLAK